MCNSSTCLSSASPCYTDHLHIITCFLIRHMHAPVHVVVSICCYTTVGFKSKDNQTHLVILRKHVSQKAIGRGKALLPALGLEKPQIAKCYGDNPLNEEEAIQAGLETWVGKVDPTWGDLLKAMETADIDVQYCDELRAKLRQ